MFNQEGRFLHVFAPMTKDGKVILLASAGGFMFPYGENGAYGNDVFLKGLLDEFFTSVHVGNFRLIGPPIPNFIIGNDKFLCHFKACSFEGMPRDSAEGKVRFMPLESLMPYIFKEDFRELVRILECESRSW